VNESISTTTDKPRRRWTANRKQKAVIRLIRGEPVDALARELDVEISVLESLHQTVLWAIEGAVQQHDAPAERIELQAVGKELERLRMDHELLLAYYKKGGVAPLASRRSSD